MTPILTSTVKGVTVTIGGILIPEVYRSGITNAFQAVRVYAMREPPVRAAIGAHEYALFHDQITDASSAIAAADVTSLQQGSLETDYLLYFKSSETSRSRRFKSVGTELFTGLPANHAVAVKKIRVDYNLQEFIDFMIDAESEKAKRAASHFKSWVRDRLGRLADYAPLVTGDLHAYVPMVIDEAGVEHVCSPLLCNTLATRAGRLPWPNASERTAAATLDEQLRAYLDYYDEAATNSSDVRDPNVVIAGPGMIDPRLQVGALNQLIAEQSSGRPGFTVRPGYAADDLGFWYMMLRAAFERDTTVHKWVKSLGFDSIEAAVTAIDDNGRYMVVDK